MLTSWRRKTPFLFFLLILSTAVMAEYSNPGGSAYDFNRGEGRFNADNADELSTGFKSLTNGIYYPLVFDADNDSDKEIFTFSANSVNVYDGINLDSLYSLNLQTYGGRRPYSPPFAFDIDKNGRKDIIIMFETMPFLAVGQTNITFIEWNGTALTATTLNYTHTVPTYHLGHPMISCNSAWQCAAVWEASDVGETNHGIYGFGFNKTSIGTTAAFDSSAGAYECLPTIRYMPVFDINNDGNEDFVFTYIEARSGVVTQYTAWQSFYVNYSTKAIIPGFNVQESYGGNEDFGGACYASANPAGQSVTSPLVFDADNSAGTGAEVIYARQETNLATEQFKFHIWSGIDGSKFAVRPTLSTIDGKYLGNPFLAHVMGAQDEDFCVQYTEADGTVNYTIPRIFCGTFEQNDGLITSTMFVPSDNTDTALGFNYTTRNYTQWHGAVQSVDEYFFLQNGYDASEFINTYGVWSPRLTDCAGIIVTDVCAMVSIEDTGNKGLKNVLSEDATLVDLEDIIVVNDGYVQYYDDGFSNTHCSNDVPSCIDSDSVLINPCLNRVWEINTTVEVSFSVTDVDGDDVAARLIAYDGNSNKIDSGWSTNRTSGYYFTYSFVANKTGNDFTLTFLARDTDDPTEIQNTTGTASEISFDVASQGAVLNDCSTSGILLPGDSGLTTINLTTTQQETVDMVNDWFSNLHGIVSALSFGVRTLLAAIFFILLTVYIWAWVTTQGGTATLALALALVIDGFGMIAANAIGLIDTSILLGFIVILLGGFALYGTGIFHKSGGGMGT